MKKLAVIFSIAMATAFTMQAVGGCSGSKVREANIKEGDYYSELEYETLSGGAKNDYCDALQAELQVAQGEMDARQREIEVTKNAIENARSKIVPLQNEVIRLDAEIRTLKDQIDDVKSLPAVWKVNAGESLTLISMEPRVYNDIDKWWKIFEANQHIIEDPYYIFPDTILTIPRDWPSE